MTKNERRQILTFPSSLSIKGLKEGGGVVFIGLKNPEPWIITCVKESTLHIVRPRPVDSSRFLSFFIPFLGDLPRINIQRGLESLGSLNRFQFSSLSLGG